MHRNTLNNIIIMKHAQKYTKQKIKQQEYTKHNNNETCIEIHKTINNNETI